MKRLDYVKAPYEKKEKVIRGKLLPKGLFGCESTPINETAMQKFRTAIATALTFATSKRSTDFAFAVASGRTDLDPDVEVYARRVTMYRRTVGGNPSMKKWQTRFTKDMPKDLSREPTKGTSI